MDCAEFVATFGLVLVILLVSRSPRSGSGSRCGIHYQCWFTSSTSFANPAVTLARSATEIFAGIPPGSVPPFIVSQVLGGAVGALLAGGLLVSDWRDLGRDHA